MLHHLLQFAERAPVRLGLGIAGSALAVQMAVDAALGPVAEYFNAWYVLCAGYESLLGGGAQAVPFLTGQERLGALALPVALLLLALQPLHIASALVALLRRLQFRPPGSARPRAHSAAESASSAALCSPSAGTVALTPTEPSAN